MRRLVVVAVVGAMASGAVRMEAGQGACAKTPAAALLAASAAPQGLLAEARGYRVEALRWDPILRSGWAVIQSCEHGEQPSLMVRTAMAAPDVAAQIVSAGTAVRPANVIAAIVRAGDLVRLWRRERNAQIEMIATAEENGAVGSRVRVRLVPVRDADGQPGQTQYLAGVVRGPADVELMQ